MCDANSMVEKTRTITIAASLTWSGTGPAPKRVKITENASVSWGGTLTIPQDGIVKGDPPIPPNGTMNGSGSTGLGSAAETVFNSPNPWTTGAKGELIVGARTKTITVPDGGTVILPAVVLTATSTTTTGADTTGSAVVTLGGYSVTVANGWARATAQMSTSNVPVGWTGGDVTYSQAFDGTYHRDTGTATITVVVGAGATVDKTLTATQIFTYNGSGTPDTFTRVLTQGINGAISALQFSANSETIFDEALSLSGSAPFGTQLTYNDLTTLTATTTESGTSVTQTCELKAKASTE